MPGIYRYTGDAAPEKCADDYRDLVVKPKVDVYNKLMDQMSATFNLEYGIGEGVIRHFKMPGEEWCAKSWVDLFNGVQNGSIDLYESQAHRRQRFDDYEQRKAAGEDVAEPAEYLPADELKKLALGYQKEADEALEKMSLYANPTLEKLQQVNIEHNQGKNDHLGGFAQLEEAQRKLAQGPMISRLVNQLDRTPELPHAWLPINMDQYNLDLAHGRDTTGLHREDEFQRNSDYFKVTGMDKFKGIGLMAVYDDGEVVIHPVTKDGLAGVRREVSEMNGVNNDDPAHPDPDMRPTLALIDKISEYAPESTVLPTDIAYYYDESFDYGSIPQAEPSFNLTATQVQLHSADAQNKPLEGPAIQEFGADLELLAKTLSLAQTEINQTDQIVKTKGLGESKELSQPVSKWGKKQLQQINKAANAQVKKHYGKGKFAILSKTELKDVFVSGYLMQALQRDQAKASGAQLRDGMRHREQDPWTKKEVDDLGFLVSRSQEINFNAKEGRSMIVDGFKSADSLAEVSKAMTWATYPKQKARLATNQDVKRIVGTFQQDFKRLVSPTLAPTPSTKAKER